MGNPIVHFEILGKDKARLTEFYQQAFGWNVTDTGGYGLVDTDSGGQGINGGIDVPQGDHSQVVIYVGVDDPAEALKNVQSLGARVVTDVTVVPGMVTYALFEDPAGNVMGIVASEPPPAAG